MYETMFDDEASVSISEALSPYIGNYRPRGDLSTADGESIQGTWKLIVQNTQNYSGTANWSIFIKTTNSSLPATPQYLTAQTGNQQVTLRWQKNTESDFLRYRIYGGTTANPTTKIDSTTGGILGTIKVISELTNYQKYHFRITAVDSAGNESVYSNEVSATPCEIMTDIDGNTYQTVKIGDQIWMKENLKVTHYNNGEAIPNVTNNTEWGGLTNGAYCDYNNDVNNATTYGRLYNWYVVNDIRNIVPSGGWHVPTDTDWQTLVDYLGGQSVAGGKMKEKGTSHWIGNPGATNESGFSALPGGGRFNISTYCDIGCHGNWWSVTEGGSNVAWYRYLYDENSSVTRNCDFKRDGFSVRCLKGYNVYPSTPINFTATSGNGQVTLKWNKNTESDFLRYRIYGGTSANPTTKIDSTTGGIPDTVKAITELTNGTKYYFRITAVDSAGNESGFSNEVSAIPDDYEAPQVNLLSPSGGEKWLEGSQHLIKWSASDNVELHHHLLFYSVDNGQNFTRIDSVLGEVDSLLWTVSNKITKQGKIKITSYDARGNSAFAVNPNPFEIVDNTPPTVHIETPQTLATGDSVTIIWTASDNSGNFRRHYLYFTESRSSAFVLLDSLHGTNRSFLWRVPDIVSSECRLRIVSKDLVGLTADDTTGYFSIVDQTPPVITILSPTAGFSVPENQPFTIRWQATDNIAMDSVTVRYIYFGSYVSFDVAFLSADSTSCQYQIYQGMTERALIFVSGRDIYGNITVKSSGEFRVTDGTPPSVSITPFPADQHFETFQSVTINWTATDNAGVQFIDLDYSVNGGAEWKPIAAHESNDGSYDWMIPDEQSENCKIRVIATDGVGLSDTSISAGAFTIVRVYPKLAAFSSVLSPLDTLVLEFTQAMDSAGFRNGCVLHSRTSGDLTYRYRFYDNLRKANLFLTESFTSRDTLSVLLTANSTTNVYGYGLDGNANGVFDGSPTDNMMLTIPVEIAGDFNNDDVVNFDDFAPFVLAWQGRDFGKELAPNRGEVPRITISPDQKYDVYDLTTFVSLWNWTVGLRKALPLLEDFPEVDFPITQEGNNIIVKPNGSDVIAYQYLVEYDPNVVNLKYTDNRLARITETKMQMVDAFPDSGRLLISEGYFNASVLPEMHLELSPKGRNPYEIIIAYQTVQIDCTRVMGKRTILLQPIPTVYSLRQNYPNPFNAETVIEYALPEKSAVELIVYDLQGREVRQLVSGTQSPRYYRVIWDGKNDAGQPVASGIYLLRMLASGEGKSFVKKSKMVLLR
ncbi:MAG: FISUMP domain-containing protein [archaeon]